MVLATARAGLNLMLHMLVKNYEQNDDMEIKLGAHQERALVTTLKGEGRRLQNIIEHPPRNGKIFTQSSMHRLSQTEQNFLKIRTRNRFFGKINLFDTRLLDSSS